MSTRGISHRNGESPEIPPSAHWIIIASARYCLLEDERWQHLRLLGYLISAAMPFPGKPC
ncbi:hypothetical protein BPSY_2216 [Bifidobacterium psychraerophilum]|uniref:Uncharacterized protein n=1 Tax=Bifidobacterium psychraerophilum TaxID=218140 RepID=A0A087CJC2_9BIFI|nr:hypothetical protein BPSY_2216 [Bifidobacterium psychraerophilum]